MSQLTVCQPGWAAVFQKPDEAGYVTEPIACWMLGDEEDDDVRPICALGGSMSDATQAANFLGVLAPGVNPDHWYRTIRALPEKPSS